MRLIITILCLLMTACATRPDATLMRRRASVWLLSQQSADGGWHSATHGIMRGGQAHTPFVLFALQKAGCDVPGREAALSFIRSHLHSSGALGLSDPDVLEYPNYATAYALRVLPPEERGPLCRYLLAQQMDESRGIAPEHPAYGGWGFGETQLAEGEAGHTDLSHTRKVLEALADAGVSDSLARQKALRFLGYCSRHPDDARMQLPDSAWSMEMYDGGFYYSPAAPGANKAGIAYTSDSLRYFASYATATCEGILALRACGLPGTDPRIQDGLRWLERWPDWTAPGGISPASSDQWDRTLFYYHLWVRSEVYQVCGMPGNWQEEVTALLAAQQQADGSFANPDGARNKEDDPLLATAMALMTLESIRP